MEPVLFKVMTKGEPQSFIFILQILAVRVRGPDTPKETYIQLFRSLLNQTNWVDQNISLFPAYISYIHEFLIKVPESLMQFGEQFQGILREVCLLSFLWH
jgi:hypothetical protein